MAILSPQLAESNLVSILSILLAAAMVPVDCACVYAEVVHATQAEYAGYVVKLSEELDKASYRRFRDLVAQQISVAKDHDAYRRVLQTYVGFSAKVVTLGEPTRP